MPIASAPFSLHYPTNSTIRFQGQRATRLAQQTLLSDMEQYEKLKHALQSDDTPYLGQLPQEFTLSGILNQKQALQALDGITKKLWLCQRQVRSDVPGFSIKPAGTVSLSNRFLMAFNQIEPADMLWQKAAIEVLGDGGAGIVYKFTLDDKSFALKTISLGWLTDLNDFTPFNEAANGLFFTALGVRDMSRFYAANPFTGWLVTEYIGPDADLSKRQGVLLQELGYHLHDNKAANYIQGIRIDHGGIVERFSNKG